MEVKVFSTQMGEKTVTTQATTWEELQGDLKKQGISFNKMKAVIGETKLTLEAGGAMLPAQGFTLFLMNKKTKAGMGKKHYASHKYGELRGSIRYILDKDPSAASHFNKEKNYTTKGTEVLRDLLGKYKRLTPALDDVKVFLAEAKAAKGKKKLAKPKAKKEGITVGKNDIPTPKRGFSKGDGGEVSEEKREKAKKPKKKNSTIEKAQKAAEQVEEETNISDVVESVKEDKKSTFSDLDDALALLYKFDVSEIDHMLHEDIQALTIRLEGKRKDLLKIMQDIAEKALKEKEEKEATEAKAKEEAKLEEEAKLKKEAEEEEIRIAQEKEETEEREKKEAAETQMRDMRDMFSDVK